jgi:hypothetical protein
MILTSQRVDPELATVEGDGPMDELLYAPPSSATRDHDDHGRVDQALGQIDVHRSMEGRCAGRAVDPFDEGGVQRKNDFDVER